MRPTFSLAFTVMLVGLAGCSPWTADSVEHRNVYFDLSPDGKRIAFSAADGDLYMLYLETQAVSRLTTTEQCESRPAFSPDGGSVVFSSSTTAGTCNLSILDLEAKRARILTNSSGNADFAPAFSPDGRYITFARAHLIRPYSMGGSTWDDFDIYVINTDGSGTRRLTQMKYYGADSPHFSSDGQSVIYSAFISNYPGPSGPRLYEVIADGSKSPEVLGTEPRVAEVKNFDRTVMGGWASDPNISPDGKTIVSVSDRAKAFAYAYDLYVMNRDGTAVTALGITRICKQNRNPVFLPNGKSILFLAGTKQNSSGRGIFSLWQVDVNGQNARCIADCGLFNKPEHWNPKH
jgi:Tol biopolymer transport system component